MQTSGNRQERINFLRRQGERKRTLSDFLSSLSLIAGRQIPEEAALSVEETDKLIQKIH